MTATSDLPERRGLSDKVGDILVVDDNPMNLVAIEAALRDFGVSLVTVDSGEGALRALLRQDFALILLDVQMPGMDGFETAKLIRKRGRSRHTPVIFVTAFDQDQDTILRAYELGAVDFLFKPIVPEVLRAKAGVFVELRRHMAEVERQAELLRQHERRELEEQINEERRRWEAELLRREMDVQRRTAEENASRAEELARIVAEREQAQAELTWINHELEEADRRKNEFLAVLAHELRTPLSPIVMGLDLLRGASQTGRDKVLDAMDRQLRHLTRLVDDLLEISRISRGTIELRREPMTVQDAIRQAALMCRPELEQKKQQLVLSLVDDPLRVDGDVVRLTQVVANLLTNASRYTDSGGHIRVSVSRDAGDALIRVEDDGHGIASDLLDRIFTMFVQSRESSGLGLGLALVKQLVELHGGTVKAMSEGEGKGSTFEVRLPLTTTRDSQQVRRKSVIRRTPMPFDAIVTDGPSDVLRVVIVEDHDDIGELLARMLERRGHRVSTARDGCTGVSLSIEQRPDVAFVDIALPDIEGHEVARRIRTALGASVRLVAVTGFGHEATRRAALEAGFDAYIVKPLSAHDLERELAAARGHSAA